MEVREVGPREGACPVAERAVCASTRGEAGGAGEGMELGFGFMWGRLCNSGTCQSWSRLERNPGAKVGMRAGSAQVWSWAPEVSQPGRPFPAPRGPSQTRRLPYPGGKVSAQCRAAPPPRRRVEPGSARPPPPPVPPPPAPSSCAALLAEVCWPSSNERVPEVGARNPTAGDSTPVRGRWRGGARSGAAGQKG